MAKGSLRVNGIIVDTDGEITASTGDSIVIREDDGSAVITVDTNGNVGINTTAPGAQFDIRGPAGTGSASASVLRMSTAETSVVDADQLGRIEFIAPLEAGGTDAILVGASIHAEADATFAADNNSTELVFSTGASEAATEKMRIDSAGNVGIGSTSPGSTFRASINGDGSSVIGGVEFRNAASGGSTITVGMASATSPSGKINVVSAGNLILQTNDTERMRIDSSGNVGIGTTSPGTTTDNRINLQVGIAGTVIGRTDDSPLYISSNLTYNSGWKYLASTTASQLELGTDISLYTVASGTAGTAATLSEVFTVKADGKVGIGSTAPSTKLDFGATSAGDNIITLRKNSNSVIGIGAGTGFGVKVFAPSDGGSSNLMFETGTISTGDGTTYTQSGLAVTYGGKVGIGNGAPDHELVIGPPTPGADAQNTIEMRGAAGDSSIQRFQIDNRGDIGQAALKLGRSGNTPTTLLGIGPDEITFTLPFIQSISTHQKIRQFYYNATIANGSAVNLFRNTNAYDDLNGFMWVEALHSGRTYRTYIFTLGGYGFNQSNAGDGSFTVTSTSSGMPGGTQALRLQNNTGYQAGAHVAGFILGDNAITNISATIYE